MLVLSEPDSLFSLSVLNFSIPINILPILMTLINFFSAKSYLKDVSIREKIQAFILPIIFLVLLYNSPSGLVIYWIFNNLFSLTKNIVKTHKNPSKILYFLVLILGIVFCSLFWIFKPNANIIKKLFLTITVTAVAFIPKLLSFLQNISKNKQENVEESNFYLFFFSCIGIALLCGLVLPCSTLVSDPIAFSFLGNTESPMSYLKTSLFVFIGLFVIWPVLIYKMFNNSVKRIETIVISVFFITALLNVFVFKYNYGTINILFNIEEEILQKSHPLLNLFSISLCTILTVIFILSSKKDTKNFRTSLVTILCIAEIVIGVNDTRKIFSEFNTYKTNIANKTKDDLNSDIETIYHLSKEEKNVVVIFIDKAVGAFFPIVQKEHPELVSNFSGFTFYPNTASFGGATLYGSPAMLGGYDYTPEKINSRPDILLKQKHNEASLMMPLLFKEAGFNVTVTDPPLPNFTEAGDLTVFDEYPEIHAKELKSVYTSRYKAEFSSDTAFDDICRKGLINFSILQILLPGLRNSFYRIMKNMDSDADDFFDSFPSLYYIRNLTDFSGTTNTFTFIGNETPHFATYLNSKNFTEVSFNKDFSSTNLNTDDEELIMNYHVFIAAIKQLGLWFEYLKENNCYDNTRIIIVSDHGTNLDIPNSFNDEKKFSNKKILSFNPLMLYKDFDSKGSLKENHNFMTNADTIFLATEGIIKNPKNTFLGTKLIQNKDNGISSYYTAKGEHNPMSLQDKKTLTLKTGFFIPKDLYNCNDWKLIDKK